MRRIVVAPRAVEVATLMQESGILTIVLAGAAYLAQFGRWAHGEAAVSARPAVATRLAALACRIDEDNRRISERLRLTNAERDRITATLAAARSFAPLPDERALRRILYREGPEAYRDGGMYAFAWSRLPQDPNAWRSAFGLPERWTAPKFPLGGRDVTASGVSGPAVGEMLRAVEAWWIEQDFAPDEAAIRSRLQQMIAAQQ
jgi:tRNA nucleotidyltransferase/poly(A) polymerase